MLRRYPFIILLTLVALMLFTACTFAQEQQQTEQASQRQQENSDTSNGAQGSNEEADTKKSSEENAGEQAPVEPKQKLPNRANLPPPVNIAITEQIKADIQRSIEPDFYRTTLVGEEEILVVINEANIALTKGVAIIVSESGVNSLNKFALASLVEPMNDHGWVTILVPAPTLGLRGYQQPPPTDANAMMNNGQNDIQVNANNKENIAPYYQSPLIHEDDFKAHEQHMLQLMQSIVQYSSNYPGFFLVIAQGTSAAWLAKIYSEQQIPQPDAFVAISANWPEHKYNKELPEYIAQMHAPVLDIYNRWDTEWTTKTAKKRSIAAERALKLHYRQREIVGQSFDHNQFIYLSKEIYGWLTYMGW
ncbi:DUF3530 family protein [Paraneptunicella aestuarii]|uniref:DUF3530 family protein n=1 Tax=Paraneptunicella aestuarii TaxID=2831148 RepID=UPI001E3FDE8C|nr:DUF3530 family protein [Paraneptunicella aestuarii]UAA38103.1 DUF3530 family protein [Paraneptunicella aestuarii]